MHDKNGVFHDDNSTSLWTEKTILNYRSKVKCIIEQYSNFTLKQINKNVKTNAFIQLFNFLRYFITFHLKKKKKMNGITTQGENIADNGGLKQSFRVSIKIFFNILLHIITYFK